MQINKLLSVKGCYESDVSLKFLKPEMVGYRANLLLIFSRFNFLIPYFYGIEI